MFGASYVGATQVLAACENPDGLIAIAPQLTTARHGETWTWRGGALELGFLLLWVIEALAAPDLDRRAGSLAPDVAASLRAYLRELQSDPEAAFGALPVLQQDLLALAPYLATWFDPDQVAVADRDQKQLDLISDSRPAMLVTAGWNDIFLEGSLELFETARNRGRTGDRLIVGPWSHGNPKDWQGAFWHGVHASTAFLSDTQLDFFDAALTGDSSGPTVRYFRTGSNTWHDAPDWPLPGTTIKILHLDGDRLAAIRPDTATDRGFISDPLNPVPTVGGATFLPGLLTGTNSGSMDQGVVEARDDVLTYTSSPLDDPLEVTGPVALHMQATSDVATTDWTGRLCEVLPDGKSYGLVDGILRVQTSDAGPVVVQLGTVSHLFSKGSRIRLQIASSNFPRFDRNPQSGAASCVATKDDMRRAHQKVAAGELHLPTIAKAFPLWNGFI